MLLPALLLLLMVAAARSVAVHPLQQQRLASRIQTHQLHTIQPTLQQQKQREVVTWQQQQHSSSSSRVRQQQQQGQM
jgi:hypothetical protein